MFNRTSMPESPGVLRDLNSMLVSVLCHLAAFIALGLFSVVSSDGWEGVKLLANMGDGLETPALDDSPLDTVELEVSATVSAAAADPLRLFDMTTMATADVAALDAVSELAAVSSGLEG